MTEFHLRNQVLERIRAKYGPALDDMRLRAEEEAALSDEEFWETRSSFLPKGADPAEIKRYMLEHRGEQMKWYGEGGQERMMAEEADKLMPFVIQVREERGEDGPLTDDQFYQAGLRQSQASIHSMAQSLQERAETEPNPLKRKFLSMFVNNVRADEEDMKELLDPGETSEEKIEAVTERMNARLSDLTRELSDMLERPPE
jgi:hypothetical protein